MQNLPNAIIMHGKPPREEYENLNLPSPSNAIWIPWLQKQLLLHGISTQTPEIFEAWKPQYQLWLREIQKQEITKNTILIGHSLGAGFLVRWLSDNRQIEVGDVFLVAPSFIGKWSSDPTLVDPLASDFFDFTIDKNLTDRVKSFSILYSTDDRARVGDCVNILRKELSDINYYEFNDKGHFSGEEMTILPELWQIIQKQVQI